MPSDLPPELMHVRKAFVKYEHGIRLLAIQTVKLKVRMLTLKPSNAFAMDLKASQSRGFAFFYKII